MMFMEYWHLSRKFSWEEQFSWKDSYIWKPTIQVVFSWSSALISRLTEDWDGRLFIKENLDMNTVMILPEVHLTLQIQSFLCLLPYLTSSVMLLCPSYPNVLFFPVTLSLIFPSLITSWKMILQHSFLENKSILLKCSFSCMVVFFSYHYNPTLSNSVNVKNYSSQ